MYGFCKTDFVDPGTLGVRDSEIPYSIVNLTADRQYADYLIV